MRTVTQITSDIQRFQWLILASITFLYLHLRKKIPQSTEDSPESVETTEFLVMKLTLVVNTYLSLGTKRAKTVMKMEIALMMSTYRWVLL